MLLTIKHIRKTLHIQCYVENTVRIVRIMGRLILFPFAYKIFFLHEAANIMQEIRLYNHSPPIVPSNLLIEL